MVLRVKEVLQRRKREREGGDFNKNEKTNEKCKRRRNTLLEERNTNTQRHTKQNQNISQK